MREALALIQARDPALEVDGERREGVAAGDGAVDATFNALRQAFPHEVNLKLYAVQSVTGGTDAQARVTVRLEEAGKLVDGQGADTDTIVASARAYVHALNKLLVKRERTAPPAVLRA
jgi:2-isopropylmalate synthase